MIPEDSATGVIGVIGVMGVIGIGRRLEASWERFLFSQGVYGFEMPEASKQIPLSCNSERLFFSQVRSSGRKLRSNSAEESLDWSRSDL